MTTTYTVHQLLKAFNIPGDFNFSVLVEPKPIQKKFSYVYKVLEIVMQKGGMDLPIRLLIMMKSKKNTD
jgi:hypothetical protein